MTVVAYIPVLIAIVGAALYAVATPERPRLAELGRLSFLAAMIALCFSLLSNTVRIG